MPRVAERIPCQRPAGTSLKGPVRSQSARHDPQNPRAPFRGTGLSRRPAEETREIRSRWRNFFPAPPPRAWRKAARKSSLLPPCQRFCFLPHKNSPRVPGLTTRTGDCRRRVTSLAARPAPVQRRGKEKTRFAISGQTAANAPEDRLRSGKGNGYCVPRKGAGRARQGPSGGKRPPATAASRVIF